MRSGLLLVNFLPHEDKTLDCGEMPDGPEDDQEPAEIREAVHPGRDKDVQDARDNQGG